MPKDIVEVNRSLVKQFICSLHMSFLNLHRDEQLIAYPL